MNALLSRNLFFIREHTGVFKAANNFDILDPESKSLILECREDTLGIFTKILRFTDYKRMTPFHLTVRAPGGKTVFEVKRGISLFLSKVQVLGENGELLGSFQQRMFSIGGKFDVLNAQGEAICTLKGRWTSWEFSFQRGNQELAKVTKKWAGLGKELFTSADNYMLEISNTVAPQDSIRSLLLAAVLCIDMVLKE